MVLAIALLPVDDYHRNSNAGKNIVFNIRLDSQILEVLNLIQYFFFLVDVQLFSWSSNFILFIRSTDGVV